jgi:hypothetical protein
MPLQVKSLYASIQKFMSKDNNDIGDLAVWLVESYLPAATQDSDKELVASLQGDDSDSSEDDDVVEAPVEVVKPKKVIKPIVKANEQKLLDQDRTSLFSKRAGVDKIKFETIVRDIQGNLASKDDDYSDDSGQDDYQESFGDFNETPLSRFEMNEVASLFEPADSGATDFSEIEKLHKIEQLSMTGSIGKIKRSS